jgi:prophage tail gpP-like protein
MIPTQGKNYTVVKGDTLWDIAGAAYGNPRKWRKIYQANKGKLRNSTIYPNTVVLIYPGEVLFIPIDGDAEKLKTLPELDDNPGEKLRFVFDGNEIDVMSGRAVLCLDTLADAFSFTVDTDGLPPIHPFGLDSIDVYIDNQKIISGMTFKIETSSSKDGETVNVSGYSSTQRIVTSVSEPPYQYRDKTLKQILKSITSPFTVSIVDNVNDDYRFKKAKVGYGENIGSFITKLASQRRVLLRSNEKNDIEILRANTSGVPIITIDDDIVLADPIRVSFDAEKRYSKYVATGKNPSKNIKGVYLDSGINSYCVVSERADEITSDKVGDPAEWMFRKQFIKSVGISFKIDGFYSDGYLIKENEIVAIEKKSLGIGGGKNFLIKSVEYEQSPDSKMTTVDLTLPEVYTDEDIVENWGAING